MSSMRHCDIRMISHPSLRGMEQPMGVSEYQLLPKDVRDALPTPEQWEAELESLESEESEL
jgi:hypothetical protein